MDEEKQKLIEYLRRQAGNKSVMTPAQLAEEIGVSAKRQSELRQDNNFPIPHTNVGRRVFYSVHAVANYLLSHGETSQPKTVEPTEEKTPRKVEARIDEPTIATPKVSQKIRNAPVDLSQQILLGFVVGRMKEQREQLDSMIGSFEKLMKSKSLHDELQQSLVNKEQTQTVPIKAFKA